MKSELGRIWAIITNSIKRSVTTLPVNDISDFQTAQVNYLGKTSNMESVYPYGLSGSPPVGSIAIMFNMQGQEENLAGMANLTRQRFKNLKEGEVAVGNYLTGSVVKFLENGDIEVTGTNDLTVTVAGNQSVAITGDSTVTIGGNADVTVTGTTTLTSTGNVSITAPLTTINGDLTVTGTLTTANGTIGPTDTVLSGTITNNTVDVGSTHTHNSPAVSPTHVTDVPM